MVFNNNSRKTNIIRSSFFSVICQFVDICFGLGYRYLFLKILSITYLGINGLFNNILGVLALAELGITNSIVYRFYAPISKEDVNRVGELMNFFRQAYFLIGLVIAITGLAITPFIQYIIKDASEIPSDVNINLVFLLFLLQSSSSYFFAYRLTLLIADQKQYLYSIVITAITIIRYLVQYFILVSSRDYTFTLVSGIAVTVVLNWVCSSLVSKRYNSVFQVKSKLGKEDRKAIYKDTSAAMLHKIGGTVLSSTDNILLSKYIGLAVAGLYANYSMIISSVFGVINVFFSGFTSSLGNAHSVLDKESRYVLYKRSLFLNFFIVGLASVCIFGLIDDFLLLWLRKAYFLQESVVILLSISFYINGARMISSSYTTACGLFVRDKARPVIEATLNLVISIAALKIIGLGGIFLGTIISSLLTVFWREPLLLYRYAFGKSVADYWKEYIKSAIVVLISSLVVRFFVDSLITVNGNLLLWLLKALIIATVFLIIHFLLFNNTKEYRYMLSQVKMTLRGKLV